MFPLEKNVVSVHLYGLHSDSFIISSSSFATNKILYEGADLVPTAVLRFCVSAFFTNVNIIIFFNAAPGKSIMVSVETCFHFRSLNHFIYADRPSHVVCLDMILQHP